MSAKDANATLWSLIDVESEKYYADSLLDHDSFTASAVFDGKLMGRKRMPAETALMEMVDRKASLAQTASPRSRRLSSTTACI